MVAIYVQTLEQDPVECNARALLDQAESSLNQSAFIECGCYLREAVRLYLHAECEYHRCLPREKPTYEAPPRVLARALRKAGPLEPGCHGWILEIVEMSNKAAHLKFVEPSLLRTGIGLLRFFLSGSPYLVQPKAGGRV